MRYLKQMSGVVLLVLLAGVANLRAAELRIGTATADITPALPAALSGQFELRIAHTAATPLTANVVALESKPGRPIARHGDYGFLRSCGHPKRFARHGPRRGAQTIAGGGCA